jgi:tetratricopeptide (TPR) repeat protein
MELNPTLAEAHFAAALFTINFAEDWPSAEDRLQQSVQISPRTALVRVFFGGFLATRHRFEEAEIHATKSLELDPLSPYAHVAAGFTMYMARRYETAAQLAERTLELQSDYALGLWVKGFACCKLGRYPRAIEALERLVFVSKRASLFVGTLGLAYALAGRRSDALVLLDEFDRRNAQEYVSPHARLLIELGLGDRDRIYKTFQSCIDGKVPGFSLEFTIGPYIDDLDSEPRFAEIFRRLHLIQPRPAKNS